jgi:hypothetical protein
MPAARPEHRTTGEIEFEPSARRAPQVSLAQTVDHMVNGLLDSLDETTKLIGVAYPTQQTGLRPNWSGYHPQGRPLSVMACGFD